MQAILNRGADILEKYFLPIASHSLANRALGRVGFWESNIPVLTHLPLADNVASRERETPEKKVRDRWR